MKKIMFSDKYGLTEAVLQGRKTVTRRLITCPRKTKGVDVFGYYACSNKDGVIKEIASYDADERMIDGGAIMPPYKVGDIVAVAQSYETVFYDEKRALPIETDTQCSGAGFKNKMFVKAEYMPHQIQILDIRAERLQDITHEDCGREGLWHVWQINKYYFERKERDEGFYFDTPREAYASLIDKISGKGTWEHNPFVWRIEFELVK